MVNMPNLNYQENLELIEAGQFEKLRVLLKDQHPADVSQFINEIPQEFQPRVFSLLDNEMASDVLVEIHDEYRFNILHNIRRDRLINIIDEMETDEAADILAELTMPLPRMSWKAWKRRIAAHTDSFWHIPKIRLAVLCKRRSLL